MQTTTNTKREQIEKPLGKAYYGRHSSFGIDGLGRIGSPIPTLSLDDNVRFDGNAVTSNSNGGDQGARDS